MGTLVTNGLFLLKKISTHDTNTGKGNLESPGIKFKHPLCVFTNFKTLSSNKYWIMDKNDSLHLRHISPLL